MNENYENALEEALKATLTEEEFNLAFKSGTVMNDESCPLTLSSSENFEYHILGFGETKIKLSSTQIPYLINALSILYKENGTRFFEGNIEALQQYTARNVVDMSITSFDLDEKEEIDTHDTCQCEVCEAARKTDMYANTESVKNQDLTLRFPKGMTNEGKILAIAQLICNGLQQLDMEEEKVELVEEASQLAQIPHMGYGDQQYQSERAVAAKDEMINLLETYEAKLTGKPTQVEEPIPTIDDVRAVLTKYGAPSAKELIMTIPEPQKSEILKQILAELR